ncbi:MAG: hypothetical protein Q7R99_03150 [bacterium]|nr:hypothetical protein [bacterium]
MKNEKLKIIALLAVFMLFVGAGLVFSQEIKKGEQFESSISLETNGEIINAVEGKIIFSSNTLELKEIRDGNSIINFWVERPKNNGNEIVFSGIIPGGYQEVSGFLFSVVFAAKEDGAEALKIKDARVLLNDGKGTLAKTAQILISQSPIQKTQDNNPPEEFTPQIASDPAIFAGQWFLVFASQDKNSGIDHYEILETKNKKQATKNSGWTVAESPYALKDQELKSFIFLKAIDKVGNERVEMLAPRYALGWYEQPLIWGIILLGAIALFIISKFLWQKLKNK